MDLSKLLSGTIRTAVLTGTAALLLGAGAVIYSLSQPARNIEFKADRKTELLSDYNKPYSFLNLDGNPLIIEYPLIPPKSTLSK